MNMNSTPVAAKTVTTAAQDLHTFAIPANKHDIILVISTLKLTTTGTSAAQTVTLNVVIGASTKSITYASRAVIDEIQVTLFHAAPASDVGTVKTVLAGSAAADAQTTITSQSMIVIGDGKMQQGV